MGDIVSLVEKASASIDQEQAEAMAKKMQKGSFDLDDLRGQLQQMEKLGGLSGLMGMMPGVGKARKQMGSLRHRRQDHPSPGRHHQFHDAHRAPQARSSEASRKKRIAAGSGTRVEEVNKLLKMHRQMADMMKTMGKKKGLFSGMMGGGAGGPQMDPAELEKLAKQGGMPGGGLPPGMPKMPGGFPGAPGGGFPGLPGLPGGGGGQPKFKLKKR